MFSTDKGIPIPVLPLVLPLVTALVVTLGGLPAQGEETAKAAVLTIKAFDQTEFEEYMRALGTTEEQIAEFRKNVEEESAKHAVDDLLRASFKDYAAAVAKAEDDAPEAAVALTQVVDSTEDPYVQAYARYQLARVFLKADDPEEAATILAEFVERDLNRTPLDSEAIYFYGHALAMIPDRELAIHFFSAFLREFPNAPQRLRSSAAQIKSEMEQQEGQLHDISDIMKFCERKIRKTSTGDPTQEKQKLAIAQLEKLIEEWEKKEKQGGGAPGGAGGINPAQNSALPGGVGKTGPLKKAPPKVAAKWGALRPSERKAIEAELNDKMSPRYKKMLEDYYKKLGKSGR